MSNIYIEKKQPNTGSIKEPLLPAATSGYIRGLCVNYGSDEFHCELALSAATACLGVLEEDAVDTSNPVSVVEFGPAVAQIGASVTAQQQLTTDANGRLVPSSAGQPVIALALESQTYVAPDAHGSSSMAAVFFYGALGPQMVAANSPISYYTASGAITVGNGTAVLNAATPLAMTLATPTSAQDGTILTISAETAQAHTVTTAANKINGGSAIITFAAQGDTVTLEAVNQVWYVKSARGSVTIAASSTAYVANGAISVTAGVATLGSSGALAITLANPTVAQERTTLLITAVTAHAHTVTTAANKINGADDTVTFAAVGDTVVLEARNQGWIVLALIGATLSEV